MNQLISKLLITTKHNNCIVFLDNFRLHGISTGDIPPLKRYGQNFDGQEVLLTSVDDPKEELPHADRTGISFLRIYGTVSPLLLERLDASSVHTKVGSLHKQYVTIPGPSVCEHVGRGRCLLCLPGDTDKHV